MSSLVNLDLNLLVALRELLRERHVTRAAARVGVTQPAMSAALGRLRRHFNDDLLVRQGNQYVLSPLAEELRTQVEAVCSAAMRLFAAGSPFDPRESAREFTLLMSDYSAAVLGPRLSGLLEVEAPTVTLNLRIGLRSSIRDAVDTVRLTDGVIAPHVAQYESVDMQALDLFRDRWVCIVDRHCTYLDDDGQVSLDSLARMEWVVSFPVSNGIPVAAPVARAVVELGVRPEVRISAESYELVPYWVAGTNRIGLVQERLARRVAPLLGLEVLPYPGTAGTIVQRLWWHRDLDSDPGHRWFRDAIRRVAAAV